MPESSWLAETSAHLYLAVEKKPGGRMKRDRVLQNRFGEKFGTTQSCSHAAQTPFPTQKLKMTSKRSNQHSLLAERATYCTLTTLVALMPNNS